MKLSELKEIIDKALKRCQRKLEEQPTIVLSESDFEKLVTWSIMKQLKQDNYKKHLSTEFTVHTQITHYKDGVIKHNRRPDILLLTEEGLKNADTPKGFIYREDSFAIELKYIRLGDNDFLKKIRGDLNKRNEIYSKSWLYVVVLIESDKDDEYCDIKDEIEKEASKRRLYKRSLFCLVMKKQKVDYDKIV